jgi:hypothetical protein
MSCTLYVLGGQDYSHDAGISILIQEMGNFTKDKSPYFRADLGFVHVGKNYKKPYEKRRKPAAHVTSGRLSMIHETSVRACSLAARWRSV